MMSRSESRLARSKTTTWRSGSVRGSSKALGKVPLLAAGFCPHLAPPTTAAPGPVLLWRTSAPTKYTTDGLLGACTPHADPGCRRVPRLRPAAVFLGLRRDRVNQPGLRDFRGDPCTNDRFTTGCDNVRRQEIGGELDATGVDHLI